MLLHPLPVIHRRRLLGPPRPAVVQPREGLRVARRQGLGLVPPEVRQHHAPRVRFAAAKCGGIAEALDEVLRLADWPEGISDDYAGTATRGFGYETPYLPAVPADWREAVSEALEGVTPPTR